MTTPAKQDELLESNPDRKKPKSWVLDALALAVAVVACIAAFYAAVEAREANRLATEANVTNAEAVRLQQEAAAAEAAGDSARIVSAETTQSTVWIGNFSRRPVNALTIIGPDNARYNLPDLPGCRAITSFSVPSAQGLYHLVWVDTANQRWVSTITKTKKPYFSSQADSYPRHSYAMATGSGPLEPRGAKSSATIEAAAGDRC